MSPADLRPHLLEDVLTWWDAHGPDPEHGGVRTCWDQTGTTLASHEKYTWSQGRWAWLGARVARAADRGLLPVDADRWAGHAVGTARFVRDHALLDGGTRTAFLTDRAGAHLEPAPGQGVHASVFADLFAALGFAGAATVEPDAEWAGLADTLLTSAAERIAAGPVPTAPYPVPAGHHSLALPMMLLGVGTEVHAASGSAASAAVVAAAGQRIAEHHLSGDDVAEMPPLEPGTAAGDLIIRHRTPGHVLELVWFLHHARHLLDGDATGGLTEPGRLLDVALHALDLGWDEDQSGLLRYTDVDGGRPRGRSQAPSGTEAPAYERLVRETWDTKLWWPHAETLYTTRLLEVLTGDERIAAWRRRVDDYTLVTFPLGPGREWGQIRDRRGGLIETVVALPVLDPFHVARSLLLRVELEADAA